MSRKPSPQCDQPPARTVRPGAPLALVIAGLLLGACAGPTLEELPTGPDGAPEAVSTSEAPLWLPICQDGICNGGETHETCPEDCEPGATGPFYCGTGQCSIDENCSNCPTDCGRCADAPSGNDKKDP